MTDDPILVLGATGGQGGAVTPAQIAQVTPPLNAANDRKEPR